MAQYTCKSDDRLFIVKTIGAMQNIHNENLNPSNVKTLFCFHFAKSIEAKTKLLSLILLLQNIALPYIPAFGEKKPAAVFEIVQFCITVL